MMASALGRFDWRRLQPLKSFVLCTLFAGSAWGIAMTAGLTAMAYSEYGMICLEDLIFTATVSVAAGILAIGPIAACRRR